MKRFVLFCLSCFIAGNLFAHSIITSSSLDFLLEESVIEFTFTYEDMVVGKMWEQEYVAKKVEDYNKKEEGRGDKWKVSWTADRANRFEPKFKELFDKHMAVVGGAVSGTEGANYRIEINTSFTEPGFNVAMARKNASIDLNCKIVNIQTGEIVATVMMRDVSANNFWGTDFDTGYRIQECYAKAGREFAKTITKSKKKKKK